VGGKLYTLGVLGRIQCLDAATGEVQFSLTPEELDGAPSVRNHGHAASPLVWDGKLYAVYSTGKAPQLLALDAETGAVLWRAVEENISYASLVPATFHDKQQLIVRTWGRVLGVGTEEGKVLWEFPAPSGSHTRDCATPLVIGDFVYTTNPYHGTLAVHVSHNGDAWEAKKVWRTGSLAANTASPIYYEGRIYGLHRKYRFDCINAQTGERGWVERVFGTHLSILRFGDRILCLDERGTLAVIRPTPRKYEELGRWKVGEYTWAHPGVDRDRLYFRDGEDLVALALQKAQGTHER
jgi:outer membrane protein assembly factor BamB